jgi:hypothetical protein
MHALEVVAQSMRLAVVALMAVFDADVSLFTY